MNDPFKEIASELEARGAVADAKQLREIASREVMPASVVEAVRLLNVVQAEASKDPKLVSLAARASLLSNQIQDNFRGA